MVVPSISLHYSDYNPINTPSNPPGASLIRMLNHFLGEQGFRGGLTSYLSTFNYSNADRQDLWNSLEVYANHSLPDGVSVADVMDTWVLQPGFPVVTAVVKYREKKIEITQSRFVLNGAPDDSKWWIPISMTNSSSRDFSNTMPVTWLKNTSETLYIDVVLDQWVILNINQTGKKHLSWC